MLAHYLTLAGRNFRRQPISTAVSILTLSLGLVSFMMAYAVVLHWHRSDAQFANADRTYIITPSLEFNDGEIRTGPFPRTNEHYAQYLKTDFPELEAVARAYPSGDVSASTGERALRLFRLIVDPEFLDIFDLPFVSGDPHEALSKPRSVVLTQDTATKLFGDEDPMGKHLTLAGHVDTTVTGVVERLPSYSHLGEVDFYASWDVWHAIRVARNPNFKDPPESWFNGYCCTTYALLPKDGSLTAARFLRGLEDFAKRRVDPEDLGSGRFSVGAVPLSGYRIASLDSALLSRASEYLSVTTILLVLGGLILGVACINYASLATARAARRAKDVGLRKVVGATRTQIASQYLFESALLVTAAVALAALMLLAAAPALKHSVEIDLLPTAFTSMRFYVFLVLLVGFVTICAGAYPAFVLSSARTVEALRVGQMRAGPRRLSRLLVGLQFVVAGFLLVAVIVMYSQNYDLRRTGLGRFSDPVLVIDNASALTGVDSETLKTELLKLPQVTAVAQGQSPFGGGVSLGIFSRSPEAGAATRSAFPNAVGIGYFSLLDIKTLAGRVFDRDHDDVIPQQGPDPNKPINIVVDRTLAQDLGFARPDDAVGQIIYAPPTLRAPGTRPSQLLRIIGVVEDTPLHIYSGGLHSNYFFVVPVLELVLARIKHDDVPGALRAIDTMWERLRPGFPASRRFLDEIFDQSYKVFSRINLLFTTLAVIAIIIAIVGLLGLAAQVANRRIHEIGIRKTLGARAREIARMLLTDFTRPVVIANLIAWPLAYIGASAYLSVFMHRIALTPLPFVASLLLTTSIAASVVARQAFSAARVRPAAVLNHE